MGINSKCEHKDAAWELSSYCRAGQIRMIIEEEAPTYFSGNKTAEEVTDIIESRIRIYVNEMK